MVGRLLGVDHGDRRIGLALSDPIPMIASPLKTITINTSQDAIDAILVIVKEYDVVLVGADTTSDLKKAYPNYFLDTKEFIFYLKKILNKYS